MHDRTRKTSARRCCGVLLVSIALVLVCLVRNSSHAGAATTAAEPTRVDVTNDLTHRYGEGEVAVNPKNPKNLVYFVMSQHWTYACQQAGDPACQPGVGPAPEGYLTVPGFIDAKIFVSFDRRRTWKSVKFPGFPPAHPDLQSKSDPMVTATPDGTFYIAWDDLHMTTEDLINSGGVRNGGVAMSKSTDGGRTWSKPVLTQTPEDRAWLVSDASTGRIYLASGLPSLFGSRTGSSGRGRPVMPTHRSGRSTTVGWCHRKAACTGPRRVVSVVAACPGLRPARRAC
jgi:hypothetical protein